MTTTLRLWKPLNNLSGTYWFENLSLTDGNFIFIYRKDKQPNSKIHIICTGGIASFKYTNETYTNGYSYVGSLDEIKAIRPWCFYTIENSEYLKKISDDSGGLSYTFDFKHYCIISGDEVLDLIYPIEPVVEIVVEGIVVESSDPGHRSLE